MALLHALVAFVGALGAVACFALDAYAWYEGQGAGGVADGAGRGGRPSGRSGCPSGTGGSPSVGVSQRSQSTKNRAMSRLRRWQCWRG